MLRRSGRIAKRKRDQEEDAARPLKHRNSKCRLLSLPGEIRNMIYNCILPGQITLFRIAGSYMFAGIDRDMIGRDSLALSQTCHQLRIEHLPLLMKDVNIYSSDLNAFTSTFPQVPKSLNIIYKNPYFLSEYLEAEIDVLSLVRYIRANPEIDFQWVTHVRGSITDVVYASHVDYEFYLDYEFYQNWCMMIRHLARPKSQHDQLIIKHAQELTCTTYGYRSFATVDYCIRWDDLSDEIYENLERLDEIKIPNTYRNLG